MTATIITFCSLVTAMFLLVSAVPAYAAKYGKLHAIVTETFNKYADGSVVGQGGWFDRESGSHYIVQQDVVEGGRKALYNSFDGSNSIITKSGPKSRADGRQSFRIRTENIESWGAYNIGENFQLGLFQGSWDGPARATMAFMSDGKVAYLDTGIDQYVDFDTYTDEEWTHVEAEWRSVDKTIRWRVNGGSWTPRVPFVGSASFSGFDTVGFVTFAMNDGGVYMDTLR